MLVYWWDLLGYIGRERYELEHAMRPYSILLGRNVQPGDIVWSIPREATT